MRTPQLAIENDTGVEMLDAAHRLFPFADVLARVFAVFADGSIGDGIKVLRIDSHTLMCLVGPEAFQFLVAPFTIS